MDSKREIVGPFVVTTLANLDPDGRIVCARCQTVLARLLPDGSHQPTPEELQAAARVPVPNFGWFCDQKCGTDFENSTGIPFRRNARGEIYY
jgi:hypothetical protein